MIWQVASAVLNPKALALAHNTDYSVCLWLFILEAVFSRGLCVFSATLLKKELTVFSLFNLYGLRTTS